VGTKDHGMANGDNFRAAAGTPCHAATRANFRLNFRNNGNRPLIALFKLQWITTGVILATRIYLDSYRVTNRVKLVALIHET
jgi:hypothetical protein